MLIYAKAFNAISEGFAVILAIALAVGGIAAYALRKTKKAKTKAASTVDSACCFAADIFL